MRDWLTSVFGIQGTDIIGLAIFLPAMFVFHYWWVILIVALFIWAVRRLTREI